MKPSGVFIYFLSDAISTMSGEELRELAKFGDHKVLSSVLKQSGNPCSTDKWDLTALMYAVWNGHVECVKYLACNTKGIDKNSIRADALQMVSCRGYSGNTMSLLTFFKF